MAKKLKAKERRELAEQLYIHHDMTQKEIAEYVQSNENVVSRWKKKYNWEDKKAAQSVTRDEILKNLYNNALEIQRQAKEENRSLTSKEVDQIVKIATSIEKLDKKLNIPTIIMVFKNFLKWLVQVDPEVARTITTYQKQYLYQINDD